MKTIIPKIVEASEELFEMLNKKNIITPFINNNDSIDLKKEDYDINERYRTSKEYGGHKLICVNYNISEIILNYHDENEDFILIQDKPFKYKDLYLFLSLLDKDSLIEKIKNKELANEDFIIIKLKFNDPKLSFFTMNKEIPHCELVKKDEPKKNPYFFVTEPSNLENKELKKGDYRIKFNY